MVYAGSGDTGTGVAAIRDTLDDHGTDDDCTGMTGTLAEIKVITGGSMCVTV